MTENSAIFNARRGAGSFRPHRQPAPTAQDCLKRGNGANWRTTRQLSGECRLTLSHNGQVGRAANPRLAPRFEGPLMADDLPHEFGRILVGKSDIIPINRPPTGSKQSPRACLPRALVR